MLLPIFTNLANMKYNLFPTALLTNTRSTSLLKRTIDILQNVHLVNVQKRYCKSLHIH